MRQPFAVRTIIPQGVNKGLSAQNVFVIPALADAMVHFVAFIIQGFLRMQPDQLQFSVRPGLNNFCSLPASLHRSFFQKIVVIQLFKKIIGIFQQPPPVPHTVQHGFEMPGRFHFLRVMNQISRHKIADMSRLLQNVRPPQFICVHHQVSFGICGKMQRIILQQFSCHIFLQQESAAHTNFGFFTQNIEMIAVLQLFQTLDLFLFLAAKFRHRQTGSFFVFGLSDFLRLPFNRRIQMINLFLQKGFLLF